MSKRKNRQTSGWEEWGGYINAKRSKLKQQFDSSEKSLLSEPSFSNIFAGISIYVNGYTDPSSDVLKQLIKAHGGQYRYYYSATGVTHIIASALPDSKIRALAGKKVVKPSWLLDSIEKGKLLPHDVYQLYVQGSRSQSTLHFKPVTAGHQAGSTIEEDDDFAPRSDNDRFHESDDDFAEFNGVESEKTSFAVATDSGAVNDPVLPKERPKQDNSHVPPAEKLSVAKAGDPNFVSEFYSHSRLHHISTWGAEFKKYVSELSKRKDFVSSGRDILQRLKDNGTLQESSSHFERVVMHIDMDCFFVSVGLLDYPELTGKPVAVTHSKGQGPGHNSSLSDPDYEQRYWEAKYCVKGAQKINLNQDLEKESVKANVSAKQPVVTSTTSTDKENLFYSRAEIASCSYEARKAGLRNGMFLGAAKKLCPELQTIPYAFEKYKHVSQKLYDIVASFTRTIEAVSCDELLVDLTTLVNDLQLHPYDIVSVIRKEIKTATGCNASAGLGPNILTARLATRFAKPNRQHFVSIEDVGEFIKKQNVKDLPGVGYSLHAKLKELGVQTCEDLQRHALQKLQKEFGNKVGKHLHDYCRGQDARTICAEKERKSVSAEINYGMRFTEITEVERFLTELSAEVANRLQQVDSKGKTLTLKLKVRSADAPVVPAKFMGCGICDNVAKSVTLPQTTDSADVIAKECLVMLKSLKPAAEDVRGMGIQVNKLQLAGRAVSANPIDRFLQKCDQKLDDEKVVHVAAKEIAMNNEQKIKRRPPARIGRKYQALSESQIDPQVFAELPAEIREQLVTEMQQNKRDQHVFPVNGHRLTQDHHQESSKNVEQNVDVLASPLTTTTTTAVTLTANVMSLSQIDQSFMDALPDDIRQELIDECQNQEKMKHTNNTEDYAENHGLPVIQSCVASSCPPVQSPKQRKDLKGKVKRSTPKKDQTKVRKSLNDVRVIPIKNIPKDSEISPTNDKSVPSLGGASNIDDVRTLISEWAESCKEPLPEDVEEFISFLRDLILNKNLEMMDTSLKFFIRLVKKMGSDYWLASLYNVIDRVQATMLSLHGSKLQITSL